jgi:hypothetical protein
VIRAVVPQPSLAFIVLLLVFVILDPTHPLQYPTGEKCGEKIVGLYAPGPFFGWILTTLSVTLDTENDSHPWLASSEKLASIVYPLVALIFLCLPSSKSCCSVLLASWRVVNTARSLFLADLISSRTFARHRHHHHQLFFTFMLGALSPYPSYVCTLCSSDCMTWKGIEVLWIMILFMTNRFFAYRKPVHAVMFQWRGKVVVAMIPIAHFFWSYYQADHSFIPKTPQNFTDADQIFTLAVIAFTVAVQKLWSWKWSRHQVMKSSDQSTRSLVGAG